MRRGRWRRGGKGVKRRRENCRTEGASDGNAKLQSFSRDIPSEILIFLPFLSFLLLSSFPSSLHFSFLFRSFSLPPIFLFFSLPSFFASFLPFPLLSLLHISKKNRGRVTGTRQICEASTWKSRLLAHRRQVCWAVLAASSMTFGTTKHRKRIILEFFCLPRSFSGARSLRCRVGVCLLGRLKVHFRPLWHFKQWFLETASIER